MDDGILSIQSAVAYGHVGNSAAVFPLQRLGFEVWPVNTVLFSNHTGYGAWRGRIVDLPWIEEIIEGIRERGVIPRVRAVLSGYLGDATLGEVVLRTFGEVRQQRPEALYACDPVMGDEGRGFFVRPASPSSSRPVPSRRPTSSPPTSSSSPTSPTARSTDGGRARRRRRVRATGPRIVACTSLTFGPEDQLGILADSADGSWVCWTPKLPVNLNGTGDAFTALFLGHWLLSGHLDRTLERAVAGMYALVEATHERRSRELALVAAQDQLVSPKRQFRAERVR